MDNSIRPRPSSIHEPVPRSKFDDALAGSSCGRLSRGRTTTLQLNVGRVCQQTCRHCHVEAGPQRTETMSSEVAQRVLTVLARSSGIATVDITGGAPELNPNFQLLVTEARRLGCNVINRCNLTVLLDPGLEMVPKFLADHEVEIVASLPCYTPANVDKQRGEGVFEKSIRVLRLLNTLGYGMPGSTLQLNLAHNPLGAHLPPSQDILEVDYRRELREQYGVEFNRLFTITNLPIGRFASVLARSGQYETYVELLENRFNSSTVANLMCRSLVSVGWDGMLYDCDFNQMLGIRIRTGTESIWKLTCFDELDGEPITTGRHCFGCTAGNGSSCGGSLEDNGLRRSAPTGYLE